MTLNCLTNSVMVSLMQYLKHIKYFNTRIKRFKNKEFREHIKKYFYISHFLQF